MKLTLVLLLTTLHGALAMPIRRHQSHKTGAKAPCATGVAANAAATPASADTFASTGTAAPAVNAAATGGGACPEFALLDYNDFQMSVAPTLSVAYRGARSSDGTGGTAQAEANAVFSDKFAGCDLSTVSATSLANVNTMAKTAVDAEDAFNTAIDAATDETQADALQVGKIKNKVLKLSGEVLVLSIKQAQGEDAAADLATEQKKMTENLTNDAGNKGAESLSVDFSG